MPHPQTRRSSHPGSSCLPATGLQSMTTSPRSRFPHQTLWDASFPWFPSYFTRHLLVTLVGPPHLSLQTLDKPRLRSWASLFSNYTHPLGELKESHGWKVTEMLTTLQPDAPGASLHLCMDGRQLPPGNMLTTRHVISSLTDILPTVWAKILALSLISLFLSHLTLTPSANTERYAFEIQAEDEYLSPSPWLLA